MKSMNHHNILQSAASRCRSIASLRTSSPRRSGSGRKRKEGLPTTNLEFEFHIQFSCGSPRRLSCQFFANQWEAETSWNVHVPRGNNVITNVISANQHFVSTLSMQIFKFQRRIASSPSLSSPPPEQPGQLARGMYLTYTPLYVLFSQIPIPRLKVVLQALQYKDAMDLLITCFPN